ncbi:hypothetical protein [Paracoccus sp. PARArs4]|nr:hypothetical protein [Paracoccus sp. PARArs4]
MPLVGVGTNAPNMWPVRIRAGAPRQRLPVADLLVSQKYRTPSVRW